MTQQVSQIRGLALSFAVQWLKLQLWANTINVWSIKAFNHFPAEAIALYSP